MKVTQWRKIDRLFLPFCRLRHYLGVSCHKRARASITPLKAVKSRNMNISKLGDTLAIKSNNNLRENTHRMISVLRELAHNLNQITQNNKCCRWKKETNIWICQAGKRQ